jgi:hypothetical protein
MHNSLRGGQIFIVTTEPFLPQNPHQICMGRTTVQEQRKIVLLGQGQLRSKMSLLYFFRGKVCTIIICRFE